MKKALLFLLLVNYLLGILVAQNAQTSIPVWQGFSQYWGYNHRINRFGDWLEISKQDSTHELIPQHFAASGSGSDIAGVKQFYSTVKTKDAAFEDGFAEFTIDAKEGENVHAQQIVTANFHQKFTSDAHAEMVLAGFDLVTTDGAKADKLEAFSIKIEDVQKLNSSSEVQARISISLQMSCKSAECQAFNQEVKYQLRVYWTAILGEGFSSKYKFQENTQRWEKKTAPENTGPERLAFKGDPAFPNMTAGIKSLSVNLDDEHHFLGWESWITPLSDFKNLLWMEMNLNFVQHQPSMYAAFKRNYTGWPKPPAKWVVHRESGAAKWEMGICMLMFKEAEIERKSKIHTIEWKTTHGNQRKAH